ncbi:piRNA biogenesis protein EXD1 [Trichonephila inaurata madagascariensis]|uniref:PiRNA biogenesis protein EXD1 n=1 Tax=Trichonephila inaurata madagascariensis TaxID=2747483 RepID=A0A8X6XW94_9ARAC|nr:piRNA biogenesis protein EXD1 [Trichonephila inaurata madagascariensis]
MLSVTDCLDLRNCTIRFTCAGSEYEGLLLKVIPKAVSIAVANTVLLPCQTKFGTLYFEIKEIKDLEVIKRPDPPQEKDETKEEKPNSTDQSYMELVYEKYGKTTRNSAVRTFMDDMFDLDGDSDIGNEDIPDLALEDGEYSVKLPHKLSNCLPLDSITIDSIDNDFHLAVKHIGNQDSIGVSLEGLKISRSGSLIWLCISTSYCTFLFDILTLSETAFHSGLKLILESSKIQKVFHNCRLASDCLYRLYNVRLVNVFDTQAADSVVMMQQNKGSKVIQRVNTLNICLSYYLGVPDEYLYESLCFDENERSVNYYGRRPLQHRFRDIMIKNVMYLRMLKNKIKNAALLPLQKVTNTYLDVVRNSSDKELQICPPVITKLPPETLLEGVKIVRYNRHKEIQPVVVSGPPYRKLANPIEDYKNYYLKKNLEKQYSESESDKNIYQISVDSSNSCKDKEMKPLSLSGDSSYNSVVKLSDTFQKTEKARCLESILKRRNAYINVQKTLNSIEPKPKEMFRESSTSKNNHQYSSEECQVKPVSNSIEVNRHVDVKNTDSVQETEATLKEHLARTSKLKMFSNETKCEKIDSLSESTQVIKLPLFHSKITSSGDQEFLEVTLHPDKHGSSVDCSCLWKSIRQQIRNEDNFNENKSKLKFIPAGMAVY